MEAVNKVPLYGLGPSCLSQLNRYWSHVNAGFSPPGDIRTHHLFGLIIRGSILSNSPVLWTAFGWSAVKSHTPIIGMWPRWLTQRPITTLYRSHTFREPKQTVNVVDFSRAQKRSILKNISLAWPVLPRVWAYEMELSSEIDRILTCLVRLQRMRKGQARRPH